MQLNEFASSWFIFQKKNQTNPQPNKQKKKKNHNSPDRNPKPYKLSCLHLNFRIQSRSCLCKIWGLVGLKGRNTTRLSSPTQKWLLDKPSETNKWVEWYHWLSAWTSRCLVASSKHIGSGFHERLNCKSTLLWTKMSEILHVSDIADVFQNKLIGTLHHPMTCLPPYIVSLVPRDYFFVIVNM